MNFDYNIAHILQQQAQQRPDAAALIDVWRGRKHVTTFHQLSIASARVAGQLKQSGISSGDGVLVLVPMSAELYITLIAIFRLGAVAQFLDPSAGLNHIAQCCAIGSPKALIGSPKAHLLRIASPALRSIPKQFVTRGSCFGACPLKIEGLREEAIHNSIQHCVHDVPALLTFTSGSTGQPKAVMRSHGFLRNQHQILSTHLKLQAGETEFCTLPMFVLANLASGATTHLPCVDLRRPDSFDAAQIWTQLETTIPQRAAAPPAFWEKLCEYSQGRTLPFLQTVHTGGGPVTPWLLDKIQALAPNAKVAAVYGSTEAEPIAHLHSSEISTDDQQKTQSGGGLFAGKIVPETQLRILPDQWGKAVGPFSSEKFESTALTQREIGEIVVTGKHVVQGYVNGVGDEETKFSVNQTIWHRTGDAGYLDEQNCLWLMGRCSARIEDERGVIYPFSVECAAQYYSFVKRAALVQFGRRRILVVELNTANPQLSELHRALPWAHLDAIIQTKKIPTDKRHNSKIDYVALQKWIVKQRI